MNWARIVLPIEMRRTLDIGEKDALEIYVEGSSVILKKYKPSCIFCDSTKDITVFQGEEHLPEVPERAQGSVRLWGSLIKRKALPAACAVRECFCVAVQPVIPLQGRGVQLVFGKTRVGRYLPDGIFQPDSLGHRRRTCSVPSSSVTAAVSRGGLPATTSTYSPLGVFSW